MLNLRCKPKSPSKKKMLLYKYKWDLKGTSQQGVVKIHTSLFCTLSKSKAKMEKRYVFDNINCKTLPLLMFITNAVILLSK